MRLVKVPRARAPGKFDVIDLDALGGAVLGGNLYYQGRVLAPEEVLNSLAQQQARRGDLTTDTVFEGVNKYFTVERAQDAAAALFVDSDGITWVYDDGENTLTGTLTPTGVVADTYGDGVTVPQITVGEDGRVIEIVDVPIEFPPPASGGGGVLRARLATAAALPSNTYANGTAGVGATLTATATGVLTVDTKTVALDDIVFVKNEAAPENNGPYKCTTAGAVGVAYVLTRCDEMDEADEFSAALISVGPEGATNPNTIWQCTTATPITVGTTAITFAQKRGDTGPSTRFRLPLSDGEVSTKFDNTSKRTLGRVYIDPTEAAWGTSGTSTATLYMLLETTNSTITVQGDLYQQSGTGSPTVIASTPTTNGTTATLVSVDVSAAFRPTTGHAGIYVARAWITTQNGTDQCTCSGAWIEVTP